MNHDEKADSYVPDESESLSVVPNSLRLHGLYSTWNSPGQNAGLGGLSLLQGIFPTQGSNPGIPQCRQILYQLSHQESPRILEWVAYSFSSGSSRPRNQTEVSSIAGRFFANWALRKGPTDGQQTHEKMLHAAYYQRNANQNYNEVASHTSQNAQHQNICKWIMLDDVVKREASWL